MIVLELVSISSCVFVAHHGDVLSSLAKINHKTLRLGDYDFTSRLMVVQSRLKTHSLVKTNKNSVNA